MRKFPVWRTAEIDNSCVQKLKTSLNISGLMAKLLFQRGIRTPQEAQRFLEGGLDELMDPFLLPGMETAVSRLEQAWHNQEKILICGDYDVDGISSIAILKEFFDSLGLKNDYYIPSRFAEGYGLNREVVELANQQKYQLLVTVDCGISSIEEVALARELGLDVIITDHHQPPDKLPPALAIINPRVDEACTSKELAGAGVAFKLVSALSTRLHSDYDLTSALDLVCLATIADVVPLLGENRILVKAGLRFLEKSTRPGLRALMEETGLWGKKLDSWHISFMLAPRLNAAGRMGEATTAVQLVMTPDENEGRQLARFLHQQNRQRQEIEASILSQARQAVTATIDLERDKVIVLGGEGWHQGVLGIVASRIAEVYGRPAILVSWEEERGRGSGRSIPGFDLHQALYRCEHLVTKFGGHRQAVGLTLDKDHFEDFRQELNFVAGELIGPAGIQKEIWLDAETELQELDVTVLSELAALEPYGEGNPVPNLVLRKAQVVNPGLVGKKQEHFKFWVEGNGKRVEAIAFGMAELSQSGFSTRLFDLVFQPVLNDYNGDTRVVLKIKDIKPNREADVPSGDTHAPWLVAPPVLVSLEESIKEQLQHYCPALVVYPTLRCLERHFLSISNSFPARIMVLLTGKQTPAQRNLAMKELVRGKPRLFLTTTPLLKYYIKNFSLPENLKVLHFLLPEEEGFDAVTLGIADLSIMTYLPVPAQLSRLERLDEWEGVSRGFIYANRSATVQYLHQQWSRTALEAGVSDFNQRQRARVSFLQGEREVLISDGRFGVNFSSLSQVKNLIFADSPYGLSEAYAFLEQVMAPEPKVAIAFSWNDMDFNRHYLEKIYPTLETVRLFLECFKRLGQRSVTVDRELLGRFTDFLGRKVDGIELGAVLRILVEVELCQLGQQKGKERVFFTGSGTVSINNSPYFLEGIAEKDSFNKWRQVCDLILGPDDSAKA